MFHFLSYVGRIPAVTLFGNTCGNSEQRQQGNRVRHRCQGPDGSHVGFRLNDFQVISLFSILFPHPHNTDNGSILPPSHDGHWVQTLATSSASSGTSSLQHSEHHHTGFLQIFLHFMLPFALRSLPSSSFCLGDSSLSVYPVNSWLSLGTQCQQFFLPLRKTSLTSLSFPTRIRSPLNVFKPPGTSPSCHYQNCD